jgi:ABC-2 type transport system ATP-binding protein
VYGGTTTALDGLSFSVPTGTVFGFLGPNGAGKSTTIDVLLDYVRPTAGTATVFGLDAQTETQAVRRRVGVLPDDYGLYDRLTARQHLSFAIDLKGASTDPDELLETVGLDNVAADRPVGGYSKGMAQRLSLALALVGDPDLLILDEPSAGLDPNGVRLVREIVREHAARAKTVFFSSHILSQVEAVCDEVAILNQGRLVAVDTVDGLRAGIETGSTVELTLGRVPTALTVADLPGVETATLRDDVLRVRVAEPAAKVAVIDRVRTDGATILDVAITAPSLDDLFSAYTDPGREVADEVDTDRGDR